jgi:hypothetical protein
VGKVSFFSNTYGQTVYGQHNSSAILEAPTGYSKGLVERDFQAAPAGSYAGLPEFPRSMLIPRSEWRERCEQLERTGSLVTQKLRRLNIPPKDQNGTSWCWGNCVVGAMETARALAGLPYVSFSPASVCGPVKGYRNVGGWMAEAAEYIIPNGVATTAVWPDNANNRSYDNAETREVRKAHKIQVAYDLPNKNFDAMFSCLLLGKTCPIGLLWWGHAIEAVDPLYTPSGFAVRIRNSWGARWEDGGYGILSEDRCTPDDGLVILGAS